MNDAMKRGLRRGLALCALLIVGGAITWALMRPAPAPDPAPEYSSAFGGPFTLTDTNGRSFSSARLRGKPFAIFFGFTRCPDVCPTTLARMARLRARLGADADRINIVFVSVDPESDTPQQIGRYLTLFEAPIIGLTGTPARLAQAQRAWRIYARRVPLDGGGYVMDHTATVFLMGPNGEFVTTLDSHESEEASLAKLRRLTAMGGAA